MELRDYLDKLGPHKMSAGQYVVKVCPYCGDNKGHFYIDPQKKVFFCHKCNEKGTKYQLMKHTGDLPQGNGTTVQPFNQAAGAKRPVQKPPQDLADKLHEALLKNESALAYLREERGFTDETIKAFRLGYEAGNGVGWVSIPYYQNGELVNVKYRTLPPAEKSFKRTPGGASILFSRGCPVSAKEAILCEGELDAISIWQAGHKWVYSIPNGCSSFAPEWVDTLENAEKIYLWLDADDKGQKAAYEVADRLGFDRCYNIVTDYKDANDYYQAVNDTALPKASRFSIPNVSPFADATESLIEKLRAPKLEDNAGAIDTPWGNVNRLTGKIENGDLITVSAIPKTGKTTWALNIATHNARKGLPVLLYCLEMRPERLAKKVVQAELNLYEHEITEARVREAAMSLDNLPLCFAYNFKSINLDNVLDIIRKAVRRYGMKLVIFDNLHYLARSISNTAQEVALISRSFKLLAEELRVPIMLIAQPRKVQEGQVITMNDLKDSSAIGADADQVIILHRNKTKSSLDGEQASASFDPKTLVRVDASRYMPGGDTVLHYAGEKSIFTEIERRQ
jgi:replicative DNA helicase